MLLGAQVVYAYSPRAPLRMTLRQDEIMTLELNRKNETVLVFPNIIQHLTGAELTNGQREGAVQFHVSDAGNLVVLKPLEERFSSLMHIMIDGENYVFEIIHSEEPLTSVRFIETSPKKTDLSMSREVNLTEVEEMVQRPLWKRRRDMMRLALEEEVLRPKLPELYKNYVSTSHDSFAFSEHYHVGTTRIAKFQTEDSLVVCGVVSLGAALDRRLFDFNELVAKLKLRIGKSGHYEFSDFFVLQDKDIKKRIISFAAIVVGDGQGNPGYISLDNNFRIALKR